MNNIPNTTQIPNVILDDVMPTIKDTALRVLLVVCRQTFGWIEDRDTKRRKEVDWISQSLLVYKTGRSGKHVGKAVDMLCKEGILEAWSENGQKLSNAKARQLNFGKIYYRINQNYQVGQLLKVKRSRMTFCRTTKGRTTKGNSKYKRYNSNVEKLKSDKAKLIREKSIC